MGSGTKIKDMNKQNKFVSMVSAPDWRKPRDMGFAEEYRDYFESISELKSILRKVEVDGGGITDDDMLNAVWPVLFPVQVEDEEGNPTPVPMEKDEAVGYCEKHPDTPLIVCPRPNGRYFIIRDDVLWFLRDYEAGFLQQIADVAQGYYGPLVDRELNWMLAVDQAFIMSLASVIPNERYRWVQSQKSPYRRKMDWGSTSYFMDLHEVMKDWLWMNIGSPVDRIVGTTPKEFIESFKRAWLRAKRMIPSWGFDFAVRPAITDEQMVKFSSLTAPEDKKITYEVLDYIVMQVADIGITRINQINTGRYRYRLHLISKYMSPEIGDLIDYIRKKRRISASTIRELIRSRLPQWLSRYSSFHKQGTGKFELLIFSPPSILSLYPGDIKQPNVSKQNEGLIGALGIIKTAAKWVRPHVYLLYRFGDVYKYFVKTDGSGVDPGRSLDHTVHDEWLYKESRLKTGKEATEEDDDEDSEENSFEVESPIEFTGVDGQRYIGIRELSRLTRKSIDTLRDYDHKGYLPSNRRSDDIYRERLYLYDDRLEEIIRVLGFKIEYFARALKISPRRLRQIMKVEGISGLNPVDKRLRLAEYIKMRLSKQDN